MQARRFLGLIFGLCATAGGLVAGINWIFDPTGLLQSAGYRQSAACAHGLRGNEATVKGHAAALAQAKTLLVGTSQVAIGVDPAALPPRWAEGGAFNLGISGAKLQTLTPLLSTLLDAPDAATRVVLGLSPGMLYRGAEHPEAAPGIGRKAMLLAVALLSRNAALESLRLWFDPGACRHPDTRPDGLRAYTQDRARRQRDGLAIQITRVVEPKLGPQWRRDLDALLVGVCRPGVRVFIVLTPHHIDWQLAYWGEASAWSKVEQFKRDATEAAAHAQQDGCAISVHDFYIVSAWTTAPRQVLGEPFLDYVHFRPAIGRRMLELLAGDTEHQGSDGAAENGRRLAPEMLDAHLASQRAALAELAGRRGPAADAGRPRGAAPAR